MNEHSFLKRVGGRRWTRGGGGGGGWVGRSDLHGVIYLSCGEGTNNRPGPSCSRANINTNPGLNFNPGFFYFV